MDRGQRVAEAVGNGAGLAGPAGAGLAIVVVLYNGAEVTRALWSLLEAQTHADWHLVLVDNGPVLSPNRACPVGPDPRVTFRANRANEGFARGVNQGLRIAVGRGCGRVLLLNPDVDFAPEFLERLDAAWTTLGAEVIAPRIAYRDRPDTAWYAGGTLDKGWVFAARHDTSDRPGTRIVDFASGCCLGITRQTLWTVGLLDESFFMYWEDADFCMRLRRAGIPIQYVQAPCLMHEGAASSGGENNPWASRMFHRSHALVVKKHFGWRVAVRTVARVVVKELGRPGSARGRAVAVAAAMARGLLTPLRPVPRLDASRGDASRGDAVPEYALQG